MRISPARTYKALPSWESGGAGRGTRPAAGKTDKLVRPGENRNRPAGITLFELLIVLGLTASVLLMAVPTFQNLLQGALDREVNHLASVIRMLRNDAVLGNNHFRLMLDLQKHKMYVEKRDFQGEYFEISTPKILGSHNFPSSMTLRDVTLFGKIIRPEDKIPVPIRIDPTGYIDPFLLHFKDGSSEYTLRVTGFTGRVNLVSGYVER